MPEKLNGRGRQYPSNDSSKLWVKVHLSGWQTHLVHLLGRIIVLYSSGSLHLYYCECYVCFYCMALIKEPLQCVLETAKQYLISELEKWKPRHKQYAPNQLIESGSELHSKLPLCVQLLSLLASWQHILKKKKKVFSTVLVLPPKVLALLICTLYHTHRTPFITVPFL